MKKAQKTYPSLREVIEYLSGPGGEDKGLDTYYVFGLHLYSLVSLRDVGFVATKFSWVLMEPDKFVAFLWARYPDKFTEADREYALPHIVLDLAGG